MGFSLTKGSSLPSSLSPLNPPQLFIAYQVKMRQELGIETNVGEEVAASTTTELLKQAGTKSLDLAA